jgi:hypothetical protein
MDTIVEIINTEDNYNWNGYNQNNNNWDRGFWQGIDVKCSCCKKEEHLCKYCHVWK